MSKSAPKHFFSKFASVSTPRSGFNMSFINTRTIKSDFLYPVKKIFVMPGDTWSFSVSSFTRLLAPLDVPMMDNLYMKYFAFFVPWRLVWDYTKNFFGEKRRPDDPDDFTIPTILFDSTDTTYNAISKNPSLQPGQSGYVADYDPATTADAGLPKVKSIYDYFDVPIYGTDDILTDDFEINALPLRSYNLIYDDWFCDEQRGTLSYANFGNTTDSADKYFLLKCGKSFDYFTSSTLRPQFGDPVTFSFGESAPVIGTGKALGFTNGQAEYGTQFQIGSNVAKVGVGANVLGQDVGQNITNAGNTPGSGNVIGISLNPENSGLIADLSSVTPLSIVDFRNMMQVQAYKEILNRSGQRLTEYIYGLYGVISPDSRLQRTEYLGEASFILQTMPIVQNSSSDATSPQGNLAAIVQGSGGGHLFTRSFTEFGYIIILQKVSSDLTYYQGLDKDWLMQTPFDIPVPVFANLSDEPIYRSELILTGDPDVDNDIFGYNERYAFYKYQRNTLNGLVRPNAPLTIGQWSLAQQFTNDVANNMDFIESDTPVSRVVAVDNEDQFIVNHKFMGSAVRCLPQYANPTQWFRVG